MLIKLMDLLDRDYKVILWPSANGFGTHGRIETCWHVQGHDTYHHATGATPEEAIDQLHAGGEMTHPYYDSSICNMHWHDYCVCVLPKNHREPHACACGKKEERESNGTSQQT